MLLLQIAMEEAVQCGAAQVILGDRPAFVTQRRLAQGLWDALAPRVVIGFLAFNTAIFAGGFHIVDNATAYQAMGLALAGTFLGLLPVALPFWEIYRFSEMNAEEIEAAVAVPEPVQSNLEVPLNLFGEDALLDWPGASESIIKERDQYMAKALAAAATGEPAMHAHLICCSGSCDVLFTSLPILIEPCWLLQQHVAEGIR